MLLISFLISLFVFKQNRIDTPKDWNDYSHLDKKNIEKIEKMFYQKNTRYSPYRNFLNKNNSNNNNFIKINEINEINETNIYENYNSNEREKYGYIDPFGIFRFYHPSNFNETKIYVKINNNNEKEKYENMDPFGFFRYNNPKNNENSNSESSNDNNFEIIKNPTHTFKDVGGYDKIKKELMQSADILINFDKYKKYNVRTPKGIIFEGPPGNGKTLMAKGFSGELNVSFIPVSGSEFSEKYVGVGASRVRDLFKLANNNKPCIIFIDEIDAVARKRGNDMGNSNSEKDQTLNQLLINLDGFKQSDGIFVIGATNRIDLLDPALIRPGRIDKNIYIGNPDSKTREEIIKIHLTGKPIHSSITIENIIEMTGGFSGAQIENLLNEAMLNALRENREIILADDLEFIANRIMAGWQATENKYSDDIINRIIIHELGHALVGFFSIEHSLLLKVNINLWSPKTPGYTLFENQDENVNIYTKNGLLSHLMVLLGGRIAEEIFYGYSVTTGAKKDLEQAYSLSKNMILNYGMGKQNIYPDLSDQSKYLIDQEINKLLLESHDKAHEILNNCKDLIFDCAEILKKTNVLKPEDIIKIINSKYRHLWNIYNTKDNYK